MGLLVAYGRLPEGNFEELANGGIQSIEESGQREGLKRAEVKLHQGLEEERLKRS